MPSVVEIGSVSMEKKYKHVEGKQKEKRIKGHKDGQSVVRKAQIGFHLR